MSAAAGAAGFLIAWLIGAAVMAAADPGWLRQRGMAARVAAWVFAGAVGVALTGGLYWLWLNLLRWTGTPYLVLEWCVLAGAAIAAWKRRPRAIAAQEPASQSIRRESVIAWIVAGVLFALIAALLSVKAHEGGDGGWDAWATWNIKAKFLYAPGADWTLAFAPVSGHEDYPVLLPLTVARTWCYMGTDTRVGPQLVAAVLSMQLFAMAAAGIALLRGPVSAVVGLSVMLCMPVIRAPLVIQYADAPLAMWMLGAALGAAAAWEHKARRRPWLIVAGVLASAAAWTKNEGVVFCAILLGATCVMLAFDERRRAWRHVALLLGAAMPLLLCLVWMKLAFGAGSYMTRSRTLEELAALAMDPDRHLRIRRLWWFIATFSTGGKLLWLACVAWVALRGVKWRASVPLWVVLIAGQLSAYYAAYLLTPLDIGWQLATSAERLMMHVAPLAALLAPLAARGDQDLAGAACRPRL